MLSRLFTKSLPKLCTRVLPHQKFLIPIIQRSFSNIEQIEKMQSKLSKAITKEIAFEQENYEQDETTAVQPLFIIK